jgi:hypothetical protein
VWNFFTPIPFERPKELGDKEFYTEDEARAFEERANHTSCGTPGAGLACNPDIRPKDATADLSYGFNAAYWDIGQGVSVVKSRRTSQVTDPPSGQVPPLTPAAQRRRAETTTAMRRLPGGPEDMSLAIRCIVGINVGPPMRIHAYSDYIQIVQTSGWVVIHNETGNNYRMVPLDGRPHLPSTIRQWQGDSRGHWEGSTLVVDTTNMEKRADQNEGSVEGSDENLHLIEKFTLVEPGVLKYEYTVDDPTAFTRPWSVTLFMAKKTTQIYEYACHEGNDAVNLALSAARAQEKKAMVDGAAK